jgi:hypothetical protein
MSDDLYDLDLLKPVYVPMPDAIRNLLSSGSTTIEDILRQDLTFRLFRSANSQLVNFFACRIDQLLRIAFDESAAPDLSAKAFAILEHSHRVVTRALMDDQKLNRTACTVIGTESIHNKSLLLNRLASITFCALYLDKNAFMESCGFILALIDKLYEPTILHLFESICSRSEGLDEIQKWLVKIGLPPTILQEIDTFPPLSDLSRMSQEANLLSGLFRLICVCASSPIIGPAFCTSKSVAVLNRTVGDYPDFVENERWECLAAIYCPKNCEMMQGLFPCALDVITDPAKSVSRCGVAALDLVTGMVQFDQTLIPFMIQMDVVSTVLQLMIRNPFHTTLHFAVLDFFQVVLKNNELRTPSLNGVIGTVKTAFSGPVRSLRPALFRLIRSIKKAAKADSRLHKTLKKSAEFAALVAGRYHEYRAILNTAYGGPVRGGPDENVRRLSDRAVG